MSEEKKRGLSGFNLLGSINLDLLKNNLGSIKKLDKSDKKTPMFKGSTNYKGETIRNKTLQTGHTQLKPKQIRNSYRKLAKGPSVKEGWVDINILIKDVLWTGTKEEFIKNYRLQYKTPDFVRISNISRFEIEDDIYFKNTFNECLINLRIKALNESWDANGKECGLLNNYIRYTYARIKEEGKIAISEDKLHGCWNTGLVDFQYKQIYCYMTRTAPDKGWVFIGFCIAGEDLGKSVVSKIKTLPPRANFEKENLLFDANNIRFNDYENSNSPNLYFDCGHVIKEHPSRLPQIWLKDVLGSQYIDTNETEPPHEYDKRLGEIMSNNKMAQTKLRMLLEEAIKISLKRCEWNYKTAIPYYNPSSIYDSNIKSIGWFLPLCIEEKDKDNKTVSKPFAALVVTKELSGNYQGQTIYKLSWAYSCARLVCRPDSDWLSPQCAKDEIITNQIIDDE